VGQFIILPPGSLQDMHCNCLLSGMTSLEVIAQILQVTVFLLWIPFWDYHHHHYHKYEDQNFNHKRVKGAIKIPREQK